MSIDLLACAICVCIIKGDRVIVLKWLSVVHLVKWEVAIVLQSKSIKLFRDVATGPDQSLATDHMFSLCFLDSGGIQGSRCRNCFRQCLLLLSTLHPCRFPFHMQDIILARSYYRQSSLAVASVDGCCLHIIIHLTADGKNATTTEFPTTETSSSILHILSTTDGTSKIG